MQQEAGRLLSDTNNDRWSLSTLLSRINTVQQEVQGITRAVKTLENLTPTANTAAVSVNANTMDIVRATKTLSNGSILPLPGITREELDYLYPDFLQWTSGEPQYFWFDGTNQQINLVPSPSAAFVATSNPIQAWESRKPADLVSPTDIPFDSNSPMTPYHMSIVHGVVALCFADDGTAEGLTKSKFHRSGDILRPGRYEEWIGKIFAQFDVATAAPSRVMFQPQGGRIGGTLYPTKSAPLAGW